MIPYLGVTTYVPRIPLRQMIDSVIFRPGVGEYREDVSLSKAEMKWLVYNLFDETELPKGFNSECGGKLVYRLLEGVDLVDGKGNMILGIEKDPLIDISTHLGVNHPNCYGRDSEKLPEIDSEDTKAKTGRGRKALKSLSGLVLSGLALTGGVLGIADISQDMQGGLNDDYKITLKELSENMSLANEIDLKNSKFLPGYATINSMMSIENPDKKGINDIDMRLDKYIFNNKIYPKMSGISIIDDLDDIENLKDYMDSKNVEHEFFEGSNKIEIGLDNFLENEKEIIKILKLDQTLYSEYRDSMINPDDISDILGMKIVPYKDFKITNLGEEDRTEKARKSLQDIEQEYERLTGALDDNLENGRITSEEHEEYGYSARKDMLNELIRHDLHIRYLDIDEVGVKSVVPNYMKSSNISETEEFREFEKLFLEDMSKFGYFENSTGEYIPTQKFNKTVSVDPKQLLDDMFTTIVNRMEYDYKKSEAIDNYLDETYNNTRATEELNKFEDEINTYKDGLGVCRDYAEIAVEAWEILQSFSEELEKVKVYSIVGLNKNHRWNGVIYNGTMGSYDLTWADSYRNPANHFNAVDKDHYFTREH